MKRALLALTALLSLAATKEVGPGSYCPLPEGDEPPACLESATRDYETFFSGLRTGEMDDAALAQVEQDLGGEDRYQALSTLAYAYYVLSQRAVLGKAGSDADVSARLERWNALIGDTYRSSGDQEFRGAVREAVGDLQARAPAIPVRCTDADGNITQCQSTAAVAQSITDVRDRTGLRGRLGRLIQRLLGGSN
jgi:hypothetical protein